MQIGDETPPFLGKFCQRNATTSPTIADLHLQKLKMPWHGRIKACSHPLSPHKAGAKEQAATLHFLKICCYDNAFCVSLCIAFAIFVTKKRPTHREKK